MRSSQNLVYAICHEVGNLLAATRLHGEFLDPDSGRMIAELSARSGSLLSLVRPLLDETALEPFDLDPSELVEGLRRGLDDPRDPRLELDCGSAAELPRVLVDGEVLHHLLLCEVFAAFERLDPGECLRLKARARGEELLLELTGGAPEHEPETADRLAGRSLSHALASYLLAHVGGGLHAGTESGRQIVTLALPLA
jgi:hypothetical protein